MEISGRQMCEVGETDDLEQPVTEQKIELRVTSI